MMQRIMLKLRSVTRWSRVESELDDEVRFHLDHQIAQGIADGLTPDEARAAALREFGGLDQVKEQCRDERGIGFFDHLARDVRYGVRGLGREPGFSVVAMLTIALGIGVNTAMFTIVHSVLFKPLPYADPGRLTMVYSVSNTGLFRFNTGGFTDAAYVEMVRSRAFERLAAYFTSMSALTGAGDPVRVARGSTTANLLPMLGVQPMLGRVFAADEDTQGRAQVAVISERLWRGRLGGDGAILGKPMRLDGETFTVVGVMPASFSFPVNLQALYSPDVWTPLVLDPGYDRNTRYRVIGRLARDASEAGAAADVLSTLQHPVIGHPRWGAGRVRVVGLKESVVGDSSWLLFVFSGAVGLVLLVACANVASLLLARGAGRTKELALRTALGASRTRLVQQLLTESAVLCVLGGGAGLLIARSSVALVLRWVPPNKLPRISEVAMDPIVVAFTAGLCALTALIIGTIPAWVGASENVAAPLQDGPGRSTARGVTRLRSALLVAEIAIVVVLLAGAGHLVKSFWLLQHVHPGFESQGVLTMQVELPERAYKTVALRKAFLEEVLAKVQALPGVGAASLVNLLPFGEMGWRGDFEVEGSNACSEFIAGKPAVSPAYFQTMGIPLARGRSFDDGDREPGERVVIISESVARRCWPDADPIGKRLRMDTSRADAWLTVVGVVGDIKHGDLAGDIQPMIYVPHRQEWRSFFLANVTFLVRVTGGTAPVVEGLRHAVRVTDHDLPVTNVAMLDTLLARSVAEPRFRTNLMFVFAALALGLACVGVAGLVAYDVTRRTREIGIRLALGARPQEAMALVMRRSVTLIGSGVLLGVPGAIAVSRLLKTFLYQVTPGDPGTVAVVSIAMIVAGVVAAFIPARRATRIQPVIALRYE